MKKLIIFDIDGTLRDERFGIPASAIWAINNCKANGHELCLCTGRSKAMIQPDILKLSIPCLIAGGGCYIEYDGNVLLDQRFQTKQIMQVLHISKANDCALAIETKTKVLVFDYYKDPAGAVRSYAGGKKPLWFFVSHWHEDHFNPAIAGFERSTAHYIFNAEVPFHGPAAKKMQSMNIYDTIHIEDATITQYGSTDAGGSFLVETDGCTIFHAALAGRYGRK